MDDISGTVAAEPSSGTPSPTIGGKRDKRTLPLGLRRYRPGIFEKIHQCGSGMVTASQVPALFKHSRFTGRYALAAHVNGSVALAGPDEDLGWWGKELEPVILKRVALQKGWQVEQVSAYAAHRRINRLIASPDAIAWRPDRPGEPGIIEIKDVGDFVFSEHWDGEPPIDVLLQHQTQYACTGATWGAIVPLVQRYRTRDVIVFDSVPNQEAIDLIERNVSTFLAMLDVGQMPEPDDHPTSIDALAGIYPEAKPSKVITLDGEVGQEAARRFDAWQQAKLDGKAAKATEEASRDWFFMQALDAGEVRIDNDRTVKISVRRKKAEEKIREGYSYRHYDLCRSSDQKQEVA